MEIDLTLEEINAIEELMSKLSLNLMDANFDEVASRIGSIRQKFKAAKSGPA